MRIHLARVLLVALATAIAGCGDRIGSDPDGASTDRTPVASTTEAIAGGNSVCGTLPADATFNGTGYIRTNAGYDHADCPFAFLLDVNNYHPANVLGTSITYGRLVPTTEAACKRTRMLAHVWRKNASGAPTYLGSHLESGRWAANSLGGPRCIVPSFVAEKKIPGYEPGSSYRLALGAVEFSSSGVLQKREIAVRTERPHIPLTPAKAMTRALALAREIRDHVSRGTIHPRVQEVFGRRATTAGRMECRLAELELSATRVMQKSYEQVGITPLIAQARVDAMSSLYNATCVQNGTMAQIQQHVLSYIDRTSQAEDTLVRNTSGLSFGEASELMSSIAHFDLTRIATGCGTDSVELMNYVRTGAIPTGMTGINVLFRDCTGNIGGIQDRLGMAGGKNVLNDAVRGCVLEPFNDREDPEPRVCSDPRATAGSDCVGNCNELETGDACSQDTLSQACFDELVEESGFTVFGEPELTEEIVALWLLESAYTAALDNTTATENDIERLEMSSAQKAVDATKEQEALVFVNWVRKMLEPVVGRRLIDTWISWLEHEAARLEREAAEEEQKAKQREKGELPVLQAKAREAKRKLCEADPNNPLCAPEPTDPAERCPERRVSSGSVWFDNPDGSKKTMADRISACSCEVLRRTSFMTAGGTPSHWNCQTEEQRRVHECETDPWGDDDRPKPGCRNAVQPAAQNRDALFADLCEHIKCADSQTAVLVDQACKCFTNPTPGTLATACNFNGDAGRLDCGPDATLICDANGPHCIGWNTGRTPFGANPLCRVPGRTYQLGGGPTWGTTQPDAFYVAKTAPRGGGQDGFFMKQGNNIVVSPETFQRTYDETGSKLVVQVLQPAQLPADKGSFKAFCSNVEAGRTNVSLGERALQPGLNTLTFDFNQACWGDGTTPMRTTYAIRTATNQAVRGAFLGQKFEGTMTRTLEPVESCDDAPDPGTYVIDSSLPRDLYEGAVTFGAIDGTFYKNLNLGSGVALDAPYAPVSRSLFSIIR